MAEYTRIFSNANYRVYLREALRRHSPSISTRSRATRAANQTTTRLGVFQRAEHRHVDQLSLCAAHGRQR